MSKIKEPVRLRQKRTKDGGASLYLDVYVNGRRKYEFLKLYLVPENTKKDKEYNNATLAFAETVRAKRVVEIRNDEYGFKKKREGMSFFEYYVEQTNKHVGKTREVWSCCLMHIRRYEKHDVMFSGITKEWCQGLKDYLNKQPLSENTKYIYFTKLRACINSALKDGVIEKNPMRGVANFKKSDVERNYLTLEELKLLTATPLRNDTLKRAFLFSCLTGLRWSDVHKLEWSDVHEQGGYTRIVFKQKKTKGLEYLDINEQAVELMGERDKGRVFRNLPIYNSTTNKIISRWVKSAGIKKHISFHCSRHTFAIMMLDLGVDIYTVSKLLGHRDLSTTQIYARVLDKNKQKAVEKIPNILR